MKGVVAASFFDFQEICPDGFTFPARFSIGPLVEWDASCGPSAGDVPEHIPPELPPNFFLAVKDVVEKRAFWLHLVINVAFRFHFLSINFLLNGFFTLQDCHWPLRFH